MMGGMSTDRPEADESAAERPVPGAAAPAAAPAAPAAPETLDLVGEGGRPARSTPPWLAGLRDDRRIVPVAAGLGAVALLASMFSEWQVSTFAQGFFGDDQTGTRALTVGVGELGGWTGGYLTGLVVLAGAVTLLLFGPRAGRAYARLAVLSTAGVLAVLLVVLVGELGGTQFVLPSYVALPEDGYEIARGRGVWCALAGVLILAFAAWFTRVPSERPAAAPSPGAAPDDDCPEDWPWRRSRATAGPDAEDDLPPPTDLTVGPAAPFTALPGDVDRTDVARPDDPWRGPGR